jgi:hypothetical protein
MHLKKNNDEMYIMLEWKDIHVHGTAISMFPVSLEVFLLMVINGFLEIMKWKKKHTQKHLYRLDKGTKKCLTYRYLNRPFTCLNCGLIYFFVSNFCIVKK